MVKNLTYRDKLLELSKIYKIAEIQNYIKRKKNLTTSQIEHILKKNNVPIPKEFNVGFFEKNFSKPLSRAGRGVTNFYDDTSKGISKMVTKTGKGATGVYDNIINSIINFFINTWKSIGALGLGILNTFPKLGSVVYQLISKIFVDFFSSFYEAKLEEKKISKFVSSFAVIIVFASVIIGGISIFTNYEYFNSKIATKENKIEKEKKITQKNKKIDNKNDNQNKLAAKPKAQEKKPSLKIQPNKDKDPSEVKELVLPNLNLKTETVLNLFEDVQYDLRTVRFEKKVKPIYFTQFPKDLDEIKNTKLKKETFIKIVLPLVVAENEKILNDRIKLAALKNKKKNLSSNEKSWLRQKSREYKISKLDLNELNKRMDVIPVSIALAQAAKESGWGTSRFALEGNAIFGQWTWTGKGIEPLEKEKNQSHKILRFPILRASVKAYKNNLNTHSGYSEFREKRFSLRKRNKNIKGLELTKTLDKYAQTGKDYTDILEQIIKQNKLSDFETVELTNSVVKKELNL